MEELCLQTGLSHRQVRKILEQLKDGEESAVPAHYGPAVNQSWLWTLAYLPVLLTLLAYFPVLQNEFTNWDDAKVISENLHIRSLNLPNLYWMFTDIRTGNWMPLTWLSFALDYLWGGLNPRAYHLDNLFLHAVNTLLVFFLSFRLINLAVRKGSLLENGFTPNGVMAAALLTSILFGLHPLHVEPVAWATERNLLLCCLFFFASLLVYLDCVTAGAKSISKYYLSLGLFLLALMAKPLAVTLPVVFLLLDAWPLGRLSANRAKVIMEKAPYFLLPFILGLLTIAAQAQAGAMAGLEHLSLSFRLMNALHSLIFYLAKMAVPIHLTAYYPLPSAAQVFSLEYILAGLLVVLISYACFYYRQKRPYLGAVWLFYLVTIAPVIGVLQAGSQAAADRFAYLPSLGFFLLFAAGAVFLFSNLRWAGALGAVVLTLAMGYGTIRQVGTWKTPVDLWENVVRVFPGINEVAYCDLANAYRVAGRLDDALKAYDQAISLKPSSPVEHEGKGIVLFGLGKVKESIQEFKKAIELDPQSASPHRDLWLVYDRLGMRKEELEEAEEAVKMEPEYVDAYNSLAISYGYAGQYEKSIETFQKALRIDPGNPQFLVNLATTYQRLGKYEEAIGLYKKAISRDPSQPVYYLNLGNTYMLKGSYPEAIEALEQAANLQPENPAIFKKLAAVYEKNGQKEKVAENEAKAMSLGSPGQR